jgi:hypothetical protein
MPAPGGPEKGTTGIKSIRVGIDVGTFEGTNKQQDPGAIKDAQFQDSQNVRISGGRVIPRGGLSQVNAGVPISAAILAMVPLRDIGNPPFPPGINPSPNITGPYLTVSSPSVNNQQQISIFDLGDIRGAYGEVSLKFASPTNYFFTGQMLIANSRNASNQGRPKCLVAVERRGPGITVNSITTYPFFCDLVSIPPGPYNPTSAGNVPYNLQVSFADDIVVGGVTPGTQFSGLTSLPGQFDNIYFIGRNHVSTGANSSALAVPAGDFSVYRFDPYVGSFAGEFSFADDNGYVLLHRANENILATQGAYLPDTNLTGNVPLAGRIAHRTPSAVWNTITPDVSAVAGILGLTELRGCQFGQGVAALGKFYVVGSGGIYTTGPGLLNANERGVIWVYDGTTFKAIRTMFTGAAGDRGVISCCAVNIDGKLLYGSCGIVGGVGQVSIGTYDGTTFIDKAITFPYGHLDVQVEYIHSLVFSAGVWWAVVSGGPGFSQVWKTATADIFGGFNPIIFSSEINMGLPTDSTGVNNMLMMTTLPLGGNGNPYGSARAVIF